MSRESEAAMRYLKEVFNDPDAVMPQLRCLAAVGIVIAHNLAVQNDIMLKAVSPDNTNEDKK